MLVINSPILGRAVKKLLSKCSEEHLKINLEWALAMNQGSICYHKSLADNYQRINQNADINHTQKQGLKPDHSNLYECTCKAIEACGKDQHSTRLAILNASINKAKFLIQEGIINEDILFKLRKIKITRTKDPKRPVIRYKDLQKLLLIIKQSNRPESSKSLDTILILFLFYTGVRISELVNLKLCHIDLESKVILIEWSKNGKTRRVGINKELEPFLTNYLNNLRPISSCEFAFILTNGSRLTIDRVEKRLKKLTTKAGLSGGAHQFRAGMATYFHNERNVPLESLQRVLGHSQINTTMIYIRSDIEQVIRSQVNW